MMKATIVIAWILALTSVSAGELRKLVDSLGDRDTLEIRYTSIGCFHYTDYLLRLNFFENSGQVAVEVIPLRNKDGTEVPASSSKGMAVRLTHYDGLRLNALVEYYDSKSPGGMCTTVDKIRFGRHLADASSPFVEITDDSCDLSQRLDVLSINEILARAELIKEAATTKDESH